MKGKKLLALTGSICLILILAVLLFPAACAKPAPAPTPTPAPAPKPAPPPAKAEPFVFKVSYAGKSGSASDLATFQPFIKYVEDLTQGRVKVEYYPDGVLHNYPEALPSVEAGITDFTMIWIPSFPGRFPLMDIFHLPGIASNQAVSNMVLLELFNKYPQFEAELGDSLVNIFSAVMMRSDLHTVKPMHNLAELKGKVIACQSEAGAKALEALGASTTVMVGSDAYMSAQRGVVDGIFAAWGWVKLFNLHEVCPYHVSLCLSPGTTHWPINKKTWDKFTPFEQTMLKYYRQKGMSDMTKGNAWLSIEVKETISGENFINWSEEDMAKVRSVFEPSWEEWAEETEALGYPGKDILKDAIGFMKEYSHS